MQTIENIHGLWIMFFFLINILDRHQVYYVGTLYYD